MSNARELSELGTLVTVNSGNIGINTSSPGARLDITAQNAVRITGFQPFKTWRDSNDSNKGFRIQAVGGNTIFLNDNTGGGTYTERMRITGGGEVYIAGTTDQGAFNLQCNGTGVWGAGAYTNGSDERIKEDIAPIASGLDVVEKLNPVTYRYKPDWSKDQSVQTGFIAQELLVALEDQNYVDGIVSKGGAAGYYSVAYQNIIPLLTKAIQELKAELDEAKTRIEVLEAA